MQVYDLSILVPSRNEMFISKTVEELQKNMRGNTEIIVALDGEWANPGLQDAPNLTIIYFPESIGQREATNQACRLSRAKYVMKLDAHCAVDEGFDVKMMEDMQDDWTMVPLMRNLHAFDWVCPDGHRRYQGPSGVCKECGKETHRDILWKAKESPRSTSFRFDKTMHFQYFGDYKKVQDATGSHLVETMSLQGSCFMLTRKKYWELNISDPDLAGKSGWGQQGVEVALKTWLSGGRVICNKKTWYAHMFRTQGGDFSFPYKLSGKDQDIARVKSRDLWMNNKWPLAIHTLDWLLEKFRPVPGWHDNTENNNSAIENQSIEQVDISKEIIFYTDNRPNLKIAKAVQNQLLQMNIPIISTSLKDMSHFGKNIHMQLERGYLTMFKQQLAALEAATADIVYFCEHDVLYHPTHFDFIPPRQDVFYYNINVWKVEPKTGHALWVDKCRQVSGLICYRELAVAEYRRRIAFVEKNGFKRSNGFEPGTKRIESGGFSDYTSENFLAKFPNIDICYDHNLTPNRWRKDQFRNQQNTIGWTESDITKIPGWSFTEKNFLHLK